MVMLLLVLIVAQTLPLPGIPEAPPPKRIVAQRMATELRDQLLLPLSRVGNPNPVPMTRTERALITAAAKASTAEAFLGNDAAAKALLEATNRLQAEASLHVLKAIGFPPFKKKSRREPFKVDVFSKSTQVKM